jgi:hypothetical protein
LYVNILLGFVGFVLFALVFRVFMLSVQQKCLRAVVYDLSYILDEYDIDYWWDFGTLLGLVREGDVIYTEVDADVSIHVDSRPSFLDTAIQADLARYGYSLEPRDELKFRVYGPWGSFADMDVWVTYNTSHLYMVTGKHHDFSRYILPRDLILPTKRIRDVGDRASLTPSLNDNVRLPAHPHQVIAYWYGPKWRIPQHYDKGNDPNTDQMEMFFWTHLLLFWEVFHAAKVSARLYAHGMHALLHGILLIPNVLACVPFIALAVTAWRNPTFIHVAVASVLAVLASFFTMLLVVFLTV